MPFSLVACAALPVLLGFGMLDVRKLAAVALLCLLWVSGAAHAVISAGSVFSAKSSEITGTQQTYGSGSTALEACSSGTEGFFQAYKALVPSVTKGAVVLPPAGCSVVVSGRGTFSLDISSASQCPANSTAVSGGCACASGYVENSAKTACEVAPPTCTAGQPVSGGYFDAGTSSTGGPPAVVCKGGCTIVFDGSFPAGSALVNGKKHYFAQGTYSNLGTTCSANATDGSGTSVSSLPNDSCAAGQIMGSVNDKPTCADAPGSDGKGTETPTDGPKTETGTKTESTVTNADGSTTKTTTETVTGAGGGKTTTTTTTTTSGDGKTSTTQTTTTKEPAVRGEESEEGEKSECEKNPSGEGCGGEATDPTSTAFYTKKEKTVASILEGAKTALQASPVGGAVGGFFSVSAGGSCTPSSGTIAYFNRSYSFDAMCSQMAMNLYLLMKGVLLLLATWWAFRIAIE